MNLIFRKIYFQILCFIFYIKMIIRYKNIRSEGNFQLEKYLSISIMKRILGINNIKRCEKIYMRNFINVIDSRLSLLYLNIFYFLMPKITKIDDKSFIKSEDNGIVYISFHLAGNLEVILYYLSRKYDECYLVYGDFIENVGRKFVGIETIEDVVNFKYLKYYNKEFKIKFISNREPTVLVRIKKALDKKKPVIMFYDEFREIIKKEIKGEKTYVEYKIDNKTAATVPRGLFTVVAKTNALIVPIVNLRKGFVNNNLKIFKPIIYNKEADSSIENERVLKEIYDVLLYCIREIPFKVYAPVWKLFREYVKDTSPIREIDYEFGITDRYRTSENYVVFFKNKKVNYCLLLKVDNFRVIKVDKLTVKIFQHFKKKNRLPVNFLRARKEEDNRERIEYLLKTGFIVKI